MYGLAQIDSSVKRRLTAPLKEVTPWLPKKPHLFCHFIQSICSCSR